MLVSSLIIAGFYKGAIMERARWTRTVCALSAAVVLAACGGGGGGDGSSGGGTTPPPPPPPPPPAAARPTDLEAFKFLEDASFGPTPDIVAQITSNGYETWLQTQMGLPAVSHVDRVLASGVSDDNAQVQAFSQSVWASKVFDEDQLRQRVAYALSQILVVSLNDNDIRREPLAMARYADILTENAFGNYRELLEEVTYSPAMGAYLTYLRNRRENMSQGRVPDENYARELMQLFTIGLVPLNADGTPSASGGETYDNDDITGLARVFTGLSWDGPSFFANEATRTPDYALRPLMVFPNEHSPEEKRFLNTVIPAGTSAEDSIDIALDALVNHPNTPPFISRQLIQRLVKSNPSPAYVLRVSNAFRTGRYTGPIDGQVFGQGHRGDLAATIAAVLLDDEARDTNSGNDVAAGKLREPVLLFTHYARNFIPDTANPQAPGSLRNAYQSNRLYQQAYRSPSVFNFYRPGYVPPGGELGNRGLVAPELQIVHESSVSAYVAFMSDYVTGAGNLQSYEPDYTAWLPLAENPPALVDALEERLTGNAISAATRTRIISGVESISISTGNADRDRGRRVQAAVLMMVTTPDYLIQE
jgi:uncharacterized protein (DUF1800 family)